MPKSTQRIENAVDCQEMAAVIIGAVLALTLLTAVMVAPDDVWNRYIAPACLMTSLLAGVVFAIIMILIGNLRNRR